MESKRILYTGNLVRGIYAGDRKHFMDFAREQYLVKWDDIREAHNVRRNYRDRIKKRRGENRTGIVKLIKMAKIGRWRADRVQLHLFLNSPLPFFVASFPRL